MFRVKPTVKQLEKYQKPFESPTEVPDMWCDFAPLLDIKSGSKIIKFSPYPYQLILQELIEKFPNVTIIKTRQLGVTEALLSIILHKAIKNRAFSAATFSLKDEDAKDNSTRSRLMLQSLNIETTNDNVHELSLKSGGSIYYKNSGEQGSRGRALSFLYFDEASHNKRLESIVAASTPSLTMTEQASKIYVSTPGLTDCYFFNEVLMKDNEDVDILDICKRVADGSLHKGTPGFYYFSTNPDNVKVIIHWRAIPKFALLDEQLRDEGGYLEWRRKKNNLTNETLQRDHNLCFQSGEEYIFTFDLVERALRGKWSEKRESKCRYLAGLDTNTTGNNFIVFSVIKEEKATGKLSLVAWYRNRKMSQEYNLFEIGKLINKFDIDKVAVEQNSGGALYLERLKQQFYSLDIRGFDTTGVSKPLMIGRLLSALERDILEMPSDNNIRKEFLNFSKVGNQFESTANTDIVMSIAICLQISELANINEYHKGFDGFSEEFLEFMRGEK